MQYKVKLEEALHKYFRFPTLCNGQLDTTWELCFGCMYGHCAGKSLYFFLALLTFSESAVQSPERVDGAKG